MSKTLKYSTVPVIMQRREKKRAVSFFFLLLSIMAIPSIPLFAKTPLCVPAQFKTISEALVHATAGDTVFADSGIYRENIFIEKGITLLGLRAEATILKGDGDKPVVTLTDNSTLCRVTVTNGHDGILLIGENTAITNVISQDNKGSGIRSDYGSPQITNNIIAMNGTNGIFLSQTKFLTNTLISHNVIAFNKNSGVVFNNNTAVTFSENIITGNRHFGISIDNTSQQSRILKNTIYGNRSEYSSREGLDRSNTAEDPNIEHRDLISFALLNEKVILQQTQNPDLLNRSPREFAQQKTQGFCRDSL